MPQNLHFVASNFEFLERMFRSESRFWCGSQDRTGGQGGVWRQGKLPQNIYLSHKTLLLATKYLPLNGAFLDRFLRDLQPMSELGEGF